MKQRILLLSCVSVAMTCLAVTVQAQSSGNNPPYIVPATADGTFRFADNDYPDKIQMTESASGTYRADNVILDHGFVFLGVAAGATSNFSFYTMPSAWAVSPAVLGYPNPLMVGSAHSVIDIAPGTYNVEFIDRTVAPGGFHTFVAVPSDNPDAEMYPASLYVLSSDKQVVEIAGNDGVYELKGVNLPNSFRVSYEKGYSHSAYAFGPASSITLTENRPVDIALGQSGISTLPYDGASEKSNIKVDLRSTPMTLTVVKSSTASIDDVETSGTEVVADGCTIRINGAEGVSKALFTAFGSRLYTGTEDCIGPYPAGIYILRIGDKAYKVALRN